MSNRKPGRLTTDLLFTEIQSPSLMPSSASERLWQPSLFALHSYLLRSPVHLTELPLLSFLPNLIPLSEPSTTSDMSCYAKGCSCKGKNRLMHSCLSAPLDWTPHSHSETCGRKFPPPFPLRHSSPIDRKFLFLQLSFPLFILWKYKLSFCCIQEHTSKSGINITSR